MAKKSFIEFLLTEAIEVKAEVNIDMSTAEKKAFQKAVEKEGFEIKYVIVRYNRDLADRSFKISF